MPTPALLDFARLTLRNADESANSPEPSSAEGFEAACKLTGAAGDLRRDLNNVDAYSLRADLATSDDAKNDLTAQQHYWEGRAVCSAASVYSLLRVIAAD